MPAKKRSPSNGASDGTQAPVVGEDPAPEFVRGRVLLKTTIYGKAVLPNEIVTIASDDAEKFSELVDTNQSAVQYACFLATPGAFSREAEINKAKNKRQPDRNKQRITKVSQREIEAAAGRFGALVDDSIEKENDIDSTLRKAKIDEATRGNIKELLRKWAGLLRSQADDKKRHLEPNEVVSQVQMMQEEAHDLQLRLACLDESIQAACDGILRSETRKTSFYELATRLSTDLEKLQDLMGEVEPKIPRGKNGPIPSTIRARAIADLTDAVMSASCLKVAPARAVAAALLNFCDSGFKFPSDQKALKKIADIAKN